MAGKDGSTWLHNYVPTNAAAAALKAHKTPGGSTQRSFLPVPASFSAPKGTGPKGAKGTALAKARAAKPKPSAPQKATTVKAASKPKTPRKQAAKPKATADPMAALLKTAKPKTTPAKAAAPKTADDYLKRATGNAPAKAAAAPSGKTTEQRILDAIPVLNASKTGTMAGSGFVHVNDVRDHLAAQGVAPREADRAMVSLYQKQTVNLVSQAAQRLLTPAQRAGAIRVGGMDKHMIATDDSIKAAHVRRQKK